MQALRAAVRLFRMHPGYAIASSLSIAVGMSLPIAVAGVVQAVAFRPVPFLEPDRLVIAYVPVPGGASGRLSLLHSLQQRSRAVARSAAYSLAPTIVGPSGAARTLSVARVSPGFFDVVGARPLVGSGFDERVDGRADRRVLISHAVWSSHFGRDESAIGARLIVAGESRVVVGVMPDGFDFPNGASLWLPMVLSSEPTRQASAYFILGRLAVGASAGAAASEIASLNRAVQTEIGSATPVGASIYSMREHLLGPLRGSLPLWSAVAALVAILCGVNFATMSFARGTARRHDIALRRALGASGGRVVGALVTESAITACVGGLMTIPLSSWLMRMADGVLSGSTFAITSHLDWQTAALGTLAAVAVGIGFAVLPAADLATVDLRSVMQGGGPGSTARVRDLRSRRALVGLQLTLALTATALVSAIVVADRRFQQTVVRVDVSRLVTATVSSSDTSLGPIELKGLTDQLAGSPGLEGAAVFNACDESTILPHGDATQAASGVACNASPAFFSVLGLRPLAGRLPLQDEIESNADVVVVMKSVAARLFGTSAMAVGRQIVVARRGWDRRPRVVIGVVDDIGDGLIGFGPSIIRTQAVRMHTGAGLLVRTRGEPQSVLRGLADAVKSADARIVVSDVAVAADVLERGRLKARGRAHFLVGIATLAVALAIIGIFSLTAYATALRARELGIRMALGATPARLVWLVVGELRWSASIGLVVGVLASVQLTGWLDVILRPTHLREPLITLPLAALVASTLVLLIVVVLGTGVPVRRMLRMDVGRVIGTD